MRGCFQAWLVIGSCSFTIVHCCSSQPQVKEEDYDDNKNSKEPQCRSGSSSSSSSICDVQDDDEDYDATRKYDDEEQQHEECTLYMAESTIPNAGWGIFTAIPRRIGDLLGSGDVCIPYEDWSENAAQFLEVDPWNDYFWDGSVMGMMIPDAEDGALVSAFCPGLGSVVNSHGALINAKQSRSWWYDDASKSNSNTLFSSYTAPPTMVVRDIPAGAEIFKFYGDDWFESPSRVSHLGYVPLTNDYQKAERMIQHFLKITETETTTATTRILLQQDLYDLIVWIRHSYPQSRTLNAFPDSFQRIQTAAAEAKQKNSSIISTLYQPDHVRSTQWLQIHGHCIDAIVLGNHSTLPGAGRGAFLAKKLVKQGQVVTTSPVRPIFDVNALTKFEFTWNDSLKLHVQHLDRIVSYQMGLNYCHGHAESTLLLCPYGAGVSLINHAPTTTSANRNDTLAHPTTTTTITTANVRLQWARNMSGHRDDLVQSSSSTWNDLVSSMIDGKPALAWEYVALRDIQLGEELFMDYGPEWTRAWESFRQQQQLLKNNNKNNSAAKELNELIMSQKDLIRTIVEQETDPYPDMVELRCHVHVVRTKSTTRNYTWDENDPRDRGHACQVLHRYFNPDDACYYYMVDVEVWPIPMLEPLRHHRRHYYDTKPLHYYLDRKRRATITRITQSHIPVQALKFFDNIMNHHHKKQQQQPQPFRHWIGLPPKMTFPELWKNKRNE